MTEPPNPRSGPPANREPASLSPEERNKMLRAAALRPINVATLVIGVGMFVTMLAATGTAWWLLPLTLATYVSLVLLAARDPVFQRKVIRGDGESALSPASNPSDEVSPERRARWLPRGETRKKVEDALVVYRKVVGAIEESDEVTRAVLDDAIPRLRAAAERLVDVARAREKAAEVARDLGRDAGTSEGRARRENLRELEERIRAADDEISGTAEEFLDLRAKVVRISIDSEKPTRANDLNSSLDGLNARLEALSEVMALREDPPS